MPLWGEPRRALVREVFRRGFQAKVACVDSRFLTDDFCGRDYDEAFVASLPGAVDTCGENGEFHTFVYNAPGFRQPLSVAVTGGDTIFSPPEFGSQRYRFARLALVT